MAKRSIIAIPEKINFIRALRLDTSGYFKSAVHILATYSIVNIMTDTTSTGLDVRTINDGELLKVSAIIYITFTRIIIVIVISNICPTKVVESSFITE
jgi:hypothetical protein